LKLRVGTGRYYLKFPMPYLEKLCEDHGWERVNSSTYEAITNATCINRDDGGNDGMCPCLKLPLVCFFVI
jgi:hypothetical protein